MTLRLPAWIILAALALGAAAPARSGSESYRFDTVHSQVLFSITHDGYSRPWGRLHIARGWLRFDPDHWENSATELDIDLDSLDMGDADWNQAVLKPSLLDATGHRHAHFVSRSVERTDDSHGVIHGQLTLRGVTKAVDVPFQFNRLARTVYGLHTVAGFSATAALDRRDFGITAFANSIGDQVLVRMEIEAIRDDGAAPATASSSTQGSL
ncbi:MAG: YceI family protein [Dyella sp.]|uniref:YceI family protein n=1 Tax=Dyella sp. TaxID=1869338 RepID=UPI003F818A83